MTRRVPTEDEVALFKAALKEGAQLPPRRGKGKARSLAKSKALRTQTPSDPERDPVSPPENRRSKAAKGVLAHPPGPKQTDIAPSRRALLEAERALFEAALQDAAPLGQSSLTRLRPAPAKAHVARASTGPGVSGPSPSGLDGRRRTKLRRGDLEPEARLDLHGLTETAAHDALTRFVHQARARGQRLVLIVTGKGDRAAGADDSDPFVRRRGVLRQLTPRWLKEPELAQFVADMTSAHRRHGGQGALYVYLRKPR